MGVLAYLWRNFFLPCTLKHKKQSHATTLTCAFVVFASYEVLLMNHVSYLASLKSLGRTTSSCSFAPPNVRHFQTSLKRISLAPLAKGAECYVNCLFSLTRGQERSVRPLQTLRKFNTESLKNLMCSKKCCYIITSRLKSRWF